MEIRLSSDQIEISRQARRFLEKEAPIQYVRDMCEDTIGITDDIWSKLTELGWLGMLIPENYGGLGLELMDMAVIFEEMGRALFPGPFFSSVMLGAVLIELAGSEEQKSKYLTQIAQGKLRVTLAIQESESGGDLDYINLALEKKGERVVLNGEKLFVLDANNSDHIIVPLRDDKDQDHISLYIIESDREGVLIKSLPSMDETRKTCSVVFNDVLVRDEDRLGPKDSGKGMLDKTIAKAWVGVAAESVAAAEKSMETAAEYAKIRVQFDQPIGSFQAVKHLCAQMYEEVESARSLMYWAAWAQDHADSDEARMAALSAKVYCTRVFRNVASNAIQVLGAAGFSWEHDAHLYLKRAKANEALLGDHQYSLESMATMLDGQYLGV